MVTLFQVFSYGDWLGTFPTEDLAKMFENELIARGIPSEKIKIVSTLA